MSDHKRRLAAVMFTDIYGYSRLMSRDENQALFLLREHNRIVQGCIAGHSGRVLKTMGDAFFAEFAAAYDAVACAVEIQKTLKEYNQDKPPHERIVIRIGLHTGDVIVDGDDLYGEGVNVAARLQPLAEPGGICLSQAVYQAVRSHTSLEAVHHGEVELKNIIEKYVVYKIPSFDPPEADDPARVTERRAVPGVLNFKVKSIQKWPTDGRNLGFNQIRWAVRIYGIVGCIAIMAIVNQSILLLKQPNFRLALEEMEILSPIDFVNKIENSQDEISAYIRGQFTSLTTLNLKEYDGVSPLPNSTMILLINEIKSVVNNKIPWFLPTYFVKNPNDLVRYKKLAGSMKGREIMAFNRELFMRIYGSDVRILVDETRKKWKADLLLFGFIAFLALFCFHLLASKVNLKATFLDARMADSTLSFITSELGLFQHREKNDIFFTRSRNHQNGFKDFASLRARIDGNLMFLTGDRSTIAKIRQLLKLHLEPA